MLKIHHTSFFNYLSLCIAIFIFSGSVLFSDTSSHDLNHETIHKVSKTILSRQDSSFPATSSDMANILATEKEVDENEENTEKVNYPVLIFSNQLCSHYFENIQNHWFISYPAKVLVLYTPLYKINCIYLI